MSTIVTRAGKGSALTHDEVDANFNNLNTDKLQSGNTAAALTITSATINGGTISGITDLAVVDGGTGASDASTARTNLGLGTISTQAASNVAITGGSIDGTTIGATTASSGRFTSLSDSGNLTFTGTGNRITGDFSNATIANRVAFQTSTANSTSSVSLIPNGTGVGANWLAHNNSDPTNSSRARIGVDSTIVSIQSDITGTGTYLPMTFYTGGSERMRVDTSGNVGIGTTSPTQKLEVSGVLLATDEIRGNNNLNLQKSTLNTIYYAGALAFTLSGTGERARIDSSGNLVVTAPTGLGYGTGSGGTVTQATSKSTGVTLNKPTGRITMANSSLAANTNVSFILTNSLISSGDTVLINIFDNATLNSYQACAENSRSGSVYIMLRNTTGVALSDSVVLTFVIIKGSSL